MEIRRLLCYMTKKKHPYTNDLYTAVPRYAAYCILKDATLPYIRCLSDNQYALFLMHRVKCKIKNTELKNEFRISLLYKNKLLANHVKSKRLNTTFAHRHL